MYEQVLAAAYRTTGRVLWPDTERVGDFMRAAGGEEDMHRILGAEPGRVHHKSIDRLAQVREFPLSEVLYGTEWAERAIGLGWLVCYRAWHLSAPEDPSLHRLMRLYLRTMLVGGYVGLVNPTVGPYRFMLSLVRQRIAPWRAITDRTSALAPDLIRSALDALALKGLAHVGGLEVERKSNGALMVHHNREEFDVPDSEYLFVSEEDPEVPEPEKKERPIGEVSVPPLMEF